MTHFHLRPVELAAAALVSIVVLLVAIAPTLATAATAEAAAGLRVGGSAGIEFVPSPEWRLA